MTVAWAAAGAAGKDWPQWGGGPSRQMISSETNLPLTVQTGLDDTGKRVAPGNIRWQVRTGPLTYGHPVIADGRVYVGTGDRGWADPRPSGPNEAFRSPVPLGF